MGPLAQTSYKPISSAHDTDSLCCKHVAHLQQVSLVALWKLDEPALKVGLERS